MRLLCDTMCGRVARYLRMCGHDAAYALDRDVEADEAVQALAAAEGRIVVTRDAALAARAEDAILLTGREVTEQLRELRDAGVDVTIATTPAFCGRCNGPLEPVAPDQPLPDYVPEDLEGDVYRCRECGQFFWQGSHWDDVRETLASL